MTAGKFITFEGGEGSGKSTQARHLAERLRQQGIEVVLTREPGGSPFAEALRALILDPETPPHSALSEALLFYAARADHLDKTIRPALNAGRWVICDRFSNSTRVYQSEAGGLPGEILDALEEIVVGPTGPDLTLILDLPAEPGLGRAQEPAPAGSRASRSSPMPTRSAIWHSTGSCARPSPPSRQREPQRCVLIDATADAAAVADASGAPSRPGCSPRRADGPGARRRRDRGAARGRPPRRLSASARDQGAVRARGRRAHAGRGAGGGRMHHGWLLAGRQGIGKATLAYRFARARSGRAGGARRAGSLAVAEDDERRAARCARCRIRAFSSSAAPTTRRPSASPPPFPSTRCAACARFWRHRAASEAWRVVIVDEANELNVNAANALLKSLEEPPPRTVFLLIASAPGRLLPTIRSRCRMLPLQPLVERGLARRCNAGARGGRRGRAARGRLAAARAPRRRERRRLLGLWRSGGLELHQRIAKLASGLPRVDWRSVHALSDELQPVAAQPRFELFFELLLSELGAPDPGPGRGRGRA